MGISDLPLLPGLGAGTFGALAAMHAGWNLNFLFLLDGDKQGMSERDRYVREYGIQKERVIVLSDLKPNAKTIEDLLDAEAKEKIKEALNISKTPNKSQIMRYFQERLASDNAEPLGAGFLENAKIVLEGLRGRLGP